MDYEPILKKRFRSVQFLTLQILITILICGCAAYFVSKDQQIVNEDVAVFRLIMISVSVTMVLLLPIARKVIPKMRRSVSAKSRNLSDEEIYINKLMVSDAVGVSVSQCPAIGGLATTCISNNITDYYILGGFGLVILFLNLPNYSKWIEKFEREFNLATWRQGSFTQ